MSNLNYSPAPTTIEERNIVHSHAEDGTTYQVEKLDPPVRRGAGERHYRLWANGRSCIGSQYHYDLRSALDSINFMVKRTHHDQVATLQARIVRLERSRRLVNTRIKDGEFTNLRQNDVWAEVRELVLMSCSLGSSKVDIEAQEKRVRLMIRELTAGSP